MGFCGKYGAELIFISWEPQDEFSYNIRKSQMRIRFLRKYMSNEAWNSADMNAHWIHDVIRRDPPSSTWLFIPSSGFWWWPFLSYSYSNLHFSLLWIGRKRSEWNGKKRWWEIPPDVLMGSVRNRVTKVTIRKVDIQTMFLESAGSSPVRDKAFLVI